MHSRALLLIALLPLTAAGCRHDQTIAERRLDAAALEAERAAIRAELKELRAQREAAATYQAAAYPPASYQTASYPPTYSEKPADLVVDTIPGEVVEQPSDPAPSIYIAPALRQPNPEALKLREREIARRERDVRLREAEIARAERTVPVPAPADPATEPVAAEPAAQSEPEAMPDAPIVEPMNDGFGISPGQSQETEDRRPDVSSPQPYAVPPSGEGGH